MARILILGGTREAAALATQLVEDGHEVITSLAGRTKEPAPLAGETRIGGFGGVQGLAGISAGKRNRTAHRRHASLRSANQRQRGSGRQIGRCAVAAAPAPALGATSRRHVDQGGRHRRGRGRVAVTSPRFVGTGRAAYRFLRAAHGRAFHHPYGRRAKHTVFIHELYPVDRTSAHAGSGRNRDDDNPCRQPHRVPQFRRSRCLCENRSGTSA